MRAAVYREKARRAISLRTLVKSDIPTAHRYPIYTRHARALTNMTCENGRTCLCALCELSATAELEACVCVFMFSNEFRDENGA